MNDELSSQLQQQLTEQAAWLNTERLLRSIKTGIPQQPYNVRPQLTRAMDGLQQRQPKLASILLHWLLMRLISEFSPQNLGFWLTPEVEQLYDQSFARILNQSPPQQLDDNYYKDLGLASGALFPAGERVVEPFSILQRSLLYRNGLKQSVQFLQAGMLAGGYRPVFRLHVHLAEKNRLSVEDWQKTCVRLAEMLRVNRSIKGIVGGSWFYDPQLAQVSPHLGFVGQLLQEGGAFRFFSHTEGRNSGALVCSNSRRQAFDAGKYCPRNYAIFWPRPRLLNWYREQQNLQRHGNPDHKRQSHKNYSHSTEEDV